MARRRNDYIFGAEKERRGCLMWVALLIAAVVAMCGLIYVMSRALNSRVELKQEKVSVMALDKTYEGFTVLHLSDLHGSALGSDLALWQQLLYSKRWDAVVMTGDMVGADGDYEPVLTLVHQLGQLNKNAPIYFIAGNDDPPAVVAAPNGTAEPLAPWVRALQQEGAIYLDAPTAQQVGKKTVWFVPQYLYDMNAEDMAINLRSQKLSMEEQASQYDAAGGVTYRALCYRLDAMERTIAAQKNMQPTDLQIAVNHSPLDVSYIRSAVEWANTESSLNFRNISLVLAGHRCGGQWRLPGIGAIYVPELGWFPGDAGVMGLDRINSVNQYVSPGLGADESHPLPGRLLNTPGVTLIKFTSSIQ